MNVKEYINSGIIESYVLGMATEAERQEFEQICASHPEVAEARDSFERSLETALMQEAPAPPAFVKEKLLQQIAPPVVEDDGVAGMTEAPVRRLNPWKWVAAASLLLLAGAAYWAYSTNEKYQDLAARQATMEKQLQQSTAALQLLQQDADILRHPMKTVALKGTEMAPQAQTTVFWDTTGTKDVYMLINNLPQPTSDQQYQLWALLDGKPIDLGVFDFDVKEKRLLVKMKNVQKAQAFAITLERRGRPNPEVPEGKAYVVGKL
ncbi:anti-sigma factor [Flavisolibacter nicotianae]|uniref:anti-sigma factor n=1 Tax=Flavisolibacter nicotianae TaxID=2364882 RepID=UPI000EB2D9CC|nr:anti-sigma factor [Flavisolibacter nicotianae]